MRYGRIVFGIVSVLALVIGAGLLHRAGSHPQDDGPGAAQERALATAKRFVHTVGVPVPAEEPTFTERIRSTLPNNVLPDVWEVRWGGMAVVEVSADGRTVVPFSNHARTREQLRGHGRTGTVIWRDDDEARAYLWKVARAIGMPAGVHMDAFSFKGTTGWTEGIRTELGALTHRSACGPMVTRFLDPGLALVSP